MTIAWMECQSRATLVSVCLVSLSIFATVALAEEVKLTGAQIQTVLSEKELKGVENGQSSSQIFRANGATFYSVGQAQQIGNWKITGNQYCSVWPPSEHWVCYDVFQQGKSIRFLAPSETSTSYTLAE